MCRDSRWNSPAPRPAAAPASFSTALATATRPCVAIASVATRVASAVASSLSRKRESASAAADRDVASTRALAAAEFISRSAFAPRLKSMPWLRLRCTTAAASPCCTIAAVTSLTAVACSRSALICAVIAACCFCNTLTNAPPVSRPVCAARRISFSRSRIVVCSPRICAAAVSRAEILIERLLVSDTGGGVPKSLGYGSIALTQLIQVEHRRSLRQPFVPPLDYRYPACALGPYFRQGSFLHRLGCCRWHLHISRLAHRPRACAAEPFHNSLDQEIGRRMFTPPLEQLVGFGQCMAVDFPIRPAVGGS